MRRALLVGINNYPHSPLGGCVDDAMRLEKILKTNDDGSGNFDCKLLVDPPSTITKPILRQAIKTLFEQDANIALFYFSGHGIKINTLGGYLVTPDGKEDDEGVPMNDLLKFANESSVKEVVIILDCCDSGSITREASTIQLREGISILTASGPNQQAIETGNRGVFTSLVCDALLGGASDVRGEVNAASVYSYCDQSLDAWQQRPRFISNVAQLTEIRMCEPHVNPKILRLITKYFLNPGYEYQLDPSYEKVKNDDIPDKTVNREHEEIFKHFQTYRDAHLLKTVGTEDMYWAAVESKTCKLTALGQLYWHLVKGGRI